MEPRRSGQNRVAAGPALSQNRVAAGPARNQSRTASGPGLEPESSRRLPARSPADAGLCSECPPGHRLSQRIEEHGGPRR
jgi:hypothetical protein